MDHGHSQNMSLVSVDVDLMIRNITPYDKGTMISVKVDV